VEPVAHTRIVALAVIFMTGGAMTKLEGVFLLEKLKLIQNAMTVTRTRMLNMGATNVHELDQALIENSALINVIEEVLNN
jgi:hypothetical protein